MSVTALDIITATFQNLNVFQQGATVPAPQANDGFKRLNRMISMWATQSTTVPFIERDEFTLVSGKGGPSNPYTIGIGGDFNIPRPTSTKAIKNAGLLLAPVSTSPA